MKTIWKYKIEIGHGCPMPVDALILSAQLKDGFITIWALVDPKASEEYRDIVVCFTGEHFNADNLVFIDTIQQEEIVFHVFERISVNNEEV